MRRRGRDEQRERPSRGRPDSSLVTREDIGYGPARPYEFGFGPGMREPREKRTGRRREPPPPQPGQGPYRGRLLRRRRPDHWIRADVEQALFQDTWIDADRILVEVDDGVVTLTGMLPDPAEIPRALRDAKGVPGVRDLKNRLEVES
ncbi:MAG TPA: BON domain-containing protein [Longimicrobiales bacterium]